MTMLFLLEFVFKVIAMGFITHDHTYLRDVWNALDFAILVVSLLSLVARRSACLVDVRGCEGRDRRSCVRRVR